MKHIKLSAWLRRENLSSAEFSKMIRAKSRGTVIRYLAGTRRPNKTFMKRIKRVTRNQVTADSFQ